WKCVFSCARFFEDRCRFKSAETLLKQLLVAYERMLSPNDPLLADVLFTMGRVVEAQARLKEAEAFYWRALEMQRPGSDHLATIKTIQRLGFLKIWTSELDKAE